ncbi:MAG: RnfABCDGE type electron transport complex subunit A [Candidatus Eisenbacteria bacterium]|uniref:Ion-translocating oxidoreductase complex subunit A n=1 Tax=Eiseniibacteriota bacterium TaxID=2212470 RepID=A0A937X800_UNCEI|nr:RnfABCDGE type electron transport complex subunit A [Candidatus Eisenbacteria bacterium]
MDLILLAINAILVKNILLMQYLGNCPFLGTSKRMETALGMGMAVIFTLTLATTITWVVHRAVLVPFKLQYMQTIAFILVIAALVQFVEIFMKKTLPALYLSLGIFLPLITTNCAVFGAALLSVKNDYDFVHMVVFAMASATGFALALVLFAGLRERFRVAHIPGALQDTAIGLITAGLMSLAFLGFKGMT